MESFNENRFVHRRSRTKHPCFFASYSRGEHAKEHFVLFDEESETVYDSQHALVLGRMAFKQLAIPKAGIERIIPTARPISIEEEQEEKHDDDADHELGGLWEYEAPEEEIVFGLGDEDELLDTESTAGAKRNHHGSETKPGQSTFGIGNNKNNKGWVMKSDKNGTYLRKGSIELFFDIPIRVDRKNCNCDDENANEFHLTTKCSHDMVFLYHILTNAGLSVGFPSKNPHTCKETETFETKTSWSVKGRTKNMNVKENLFRKLKGNGFAGVECEIAEKKPKKPSIRVSDNRRRSSFLDGLFDALYDVQGLSR
mmetsp:Transcript_17871/g.44553  ORF Transcript_17871/g.44553 Transcript_17871/m.44553 type:complete len:312 (-) Transcript_17871:149-1084(-)